MNENLYSLFESRFPADRARPLLILEDGREISYGEAESACARYASFLAGLGLAPGERVAVQVEKSPEALLLYLACLRAGLVYLPLNSAYQQGEVGYFLENAEPGAVVAQPRSMPWLGPLAAARGIRHVFSLDEHGKGTFADAAAGASARFATVERSLDDLAAILYTSGTTGRSKGAMITHRNLASNATVLHDYWGFRPDDVLVHMLPLFHVHGLFVSGSAPLLAETHAEFEKRTGHRILERYGMTETGMLTSNPLEGERRPGTVGFPLPGTLVRVVDDTGRTCETGDVGHVQVKGDNVLPGYWRMPEKNKEEFTADGWFRTGDVGSFSPDGYLAIVGRSKDLIITGGYNVYPKEVELAIDELPAVAESAVVGVPHPDFGEAVTAVVVPRAGSAAPTEAEVIAWLRSRLANFKVPKRVFLVQELPRNTMGKVQKNVLRDRYAAPGA
ncbi:MAG TPA: AMP-binding protein [Usitatibacteraceae bacterium]|nr:AMP-binding protein [Usitatibacteraceae bacterium]